MHELAIAESVVAIAERHAGGRRVTRVELKVGHLRQAVPSALTFAFDLLIEETVLEGARLIIEEVPAAGVCHNCGAETTLPTFPLQCGSCGGLDVEVTAGEELLVESLELEDEHEQALSINGGRTDG
jgi:hydrogenase nickel incorporation protein HypA/HybF